MQFDEELQYYAEFLVAADVFIAWAEKSCSGLLHETALSDFLFKLKFSNPLVTKGDAKDPSFLQQGDLYVRHSQEETSLLFNDSAQRDLSKLYGASLRLVETMVEKKGRKFTCKEAKWLSGEVLRCMDIVCQPDMVDQMPREEMKLVVPRILNILAINKSREMMRPVKPKQNNRGMMRGYDLLLFFSCLFLCFVIYIYMYMYSVKTPGVARELGDGS
jgi:hypothetical protein